MALDIESVCQAIINLKIPETALFFLILFIFFNNAFMDALSRLKEKKPIPKDYLMIAIFASPLIYRFGFNSLVNYVTGLFAGVIGILYGFFLERESHDKEREEVSQRNKEHIINSLLMEMQENSDKIDEGIKYREDEDFYYFKTTLSISSFDSVVQSGNFILLTADTQRSVASFYDACKLMNLCFFNFLFDLENYMASIASNNIKQVFDELEDKKDKIIEQLKSEI